MDEPSELKKKILVLDDNPDILDIFSVVLSEMGYMVITSETHDMLNHLSEIKPDLIILDNCLGTLSGGDVCKKLKTEPLTKNIPIILCSAIDNLDQLSLDCGADNFLSKPFDMAELEKVVSGTLRLL